MRSARAISSFLTCGFAAAAVIQNRAASFWQPTIGTRWQIILSANLNMATDLAPADAKIWDLDLFNTDQATIETLHENGDKVICYYSAGTSEQDRPDLSGLKQSDYGKGLPDWPGENYLDIRSDSVWNVMKSRIDMASSKKCDAVDPDNMDGYSNDNGLGLTQADAVAFQQKMANYAHELGMGIGLKNAEETLAAVSDFTDFAVNEECTKTGKCQMYDNFLAAGKPVYHIEYGSKSDMSTYCLQSMSNGGQFDTVIKNLSLDGWVVYCDGSEYNTAVAQKNGRRQGVSS